MYKSFLIKYAEIAIKGKNRYLFEDALVSQINTSLKKVDGEFHVRKEQGRIYVDTLSDYDFDETVAALTKVFGIVGVCPVVLLEDEGFDKLAEDVIGDSAKALVADMKDGDVICLENVRFHKEEEKNDPEFSKALASLAEVYVNDAFGTAHRAHASTAGVADYLPAVCGYLIQKEIDIMGKALSNPERPFVAILGGAKVSDKIGVINNLIEKVDSLIIGGGMAYTFLKAQGYEIGKSICENDKLDLAKELLAKAEAKGVKMYLPVDTVVADGFSNDANFKTVDSKEIPADWEGLDIGANTIALFSDVVKNAKTVIWNGPMGVFEMSNFAKGTISVAEAIAASDSISIIGGGDSAAAVEQFGFGDKVTHISTGGGASLEFLEGIVLPGIDCLNDK